MCRVREYHVLARSYAEMVDNRLFNVNDDGLVFRRREREDNLRSVEPPCFTRELHIDGVLEPERDHRLSPLLSLSWILLMAGHCQGTPRRRARSSTRPRAADRCSSASSASLMPNDRMATTARSSSAMDIRRLGRGSRTRARSATKSSLTGRIRCRWIGSERKLVYAA